jgi:Phage tail tube protein
VSLKKDTYESDEIASHFQVRDFRHGVRRVNGKLNGRLSAGTFKEFFQQALKRDFTAVTAATAVSVTIAGSGPTYTVTRAAGSYLTDGFKVGMGIRLSVGALNAANINKNLWIVALTATIATVIPMNAAALVAEGPITGTTVTATGKYTFVPTTGHTDKSFSLEDWQPDMSPTQSELYTGCKIAGCEIGLPPTGLASVNWDIVGKDLTTSTSQYFTSPTAETTTALMAAVNGLLRVGGVTQAVVTGLTLNITPLYTGDPVVGSNTVPFQFPGRVRVTGQLTAYFDSATLRDAFINETEVELLAVFTADNSATSDFMAFALPRIKTGSASKSDGEGGTQLTLTFQALLATTGGAGVANELTTIQIQDTQA